VFKVIFRSGNSLFLSSETKEHDRPAEFDRSTGQSFSNTHNNRHSGSIVICSRHDFVTASQMIQMCAKYDHLVFKFGIRSFQESNNIVSSPVRNMFCLVDYGKHFSCGERLRLDCHFDLFDHRLMDSASTRKNISDHCLSHMRINKSFAVSVVRIADRTVIVEHPFSAVSHSVFQLVLMKRIRPPFLEDFCPIIRPERSLPLH